MKKRITGTREWAANEKNLFKGCSHQCLYCYAKALGIQWGWTSVDTWPVMRIKPNEKKVSRRMKVEGRIMYPTTHDITPETLDFQIDYVRKFLVAGNEMLLVSKPHIKCVHDICQAFVEWKSQITFRFTIGSSDSEVLRFWEPGAPSFEERLASLKHAFDTGYETSISCEPMLDNDVEKVVNSVYPFVTDTIWIGKMNMAKSRLRMNNAGEEAIAKAETLLQQHDDTRIWEIYNRYKDDEKIRWKDSIKKVVGIDLPATAGLDI